MATQGKKPLYREVVDGFIFKDSLRTTGNHTYAKNASTGVVTFPVWAEPLSSRVAWENARLRLQLASWLILPAYKDLNISSKPNENEYISDA